MGRRKFNKYKITVESKSDNNEINSIDDVNRGIILGSDGTRAQSLVFGSWSEENMVTSIFHLLQVLNDVSMQEKEKGADFQVLSDPELLKRIICDYIDEVLDFEDDDCETVNVDLKGFLQQALDSFLNNDDE